MNRRQLQSMSDKLGVPRGTVEKDHALTCFLCAVAGFPKLDAVMFKGGTAIKKMHYRDVPGSPRISTLRERTAFPKNSAAS